MSAMNKKLLVVAAVCLIMSALPTEACAALGKPGVPNVSVQQEQTGGRVVKAAKETEEETAKWQQEMLESVNAQRKKAGLPALTLNEEICKAAQVRAKECKENYSHTRPNKQSCKTAMDEQGVEYSWWGENINEKQKTVASAMKSWMASDGHKANILNKNFTQIGFGRAKGSDGSYYWVQLFAKTK